MTVYVDTARPSLRNGAWRYGAASHMTADTPDELHAMAAKIGLRRSWFQSKPTQPWFDHYDLTASKRSLAVRHGAVEVDWREGVRLAQQRRHAQQPAAAPQERTGER